jgi:hypothetical protein
MQSKFLKKGVKMKVNFKNFMEGFAILSLCILYIGSFAFSADTGSLRVHVHDSKKEPLPGVAVVVSSPDMMGTRSLVTDEDGEALFIRLFPAVYEVKTSLEGFQTVISKNIRVRLEQETTVKIEMKLESIQESITVTAEYPLIDTKSATVTEHITHDVVESLPIARDYVGYLQLASGVDVVPNSGGRDTPRDPAGKGGLNYYARNARPGSRDNLYLLDGINVTGMATQSSMMTFNNEVIQEQLVVTSGVPAEYGGGKGVVTNIITKSGGNRLSGSVNVYVQRKGFHWGYKGLAAERTSLQGYKDNKYDTAFTLGGPAMHDKIWFFVSGQYRNNADTFNLSKSASSTEEEVNYSEDRYNGFGKLSFNVSPRDSLTLTYFLDYYDIKGSRSKNTIMSRQPLNERHYMAYSGYYQRVFSNNLVVDFRYGHYEIRNRNKSLYPDEGVFDDLLFIPGTPAPIEERRFGTLPNVTNDKNTRDLFSASVDWYPGDIRIKGGVMYTNEYDKDDSYMPYEEQRNSIDPNLAGWTLKDLMKERVWYYSEFRYRLLPYMNSHWDDTASYYDLNGDGTLTQQELEQATFTDMNERGLNFWRWYQIQKGINKVRAKRWTGYLMTEWKISRYFNLNTGLRLENHNYRDSEGGEILHMKTTVLPRVGLIWDIGGEGNHKLTIFYGHYSDPMDFNSIHFAGNITGRVLAKQIWLANDWYTYRMYGSPEHRDATFTPNLKDPVSREFSITHQIYLGSGMVLRSQGYLRHDRNLVEDFDISLYVDNIVGDPIWGHLALTWEDFGYPASGPPEGANFFLANLIGGKRNIYGFDFEFSKQFTRGTRVVFQYSFKDNRGNSTTDKDALYQGDMAELDPRNDWMWGRLPGTIPHKLKLYGTYRTPIGVNVGLMISWNSGVVLTESYRRKDTYINWPLNDEWTELTKTGEITGPSWYQAHLKLRYIMQLVERTRMEIFIDVYNLTNNQNGWWIEAARNTSWEFMEVNRVINPRRVYLGARFRF